MTLLKWMCGDVTIDVNPCVGFQFCTSVAVVMSSNRYTPGFGHAQLPDFRIQDIRLQIRLNRQILLVHPAKPRSGELKAAPTNLVLGLIRPDDPTLLQTPK